MTRHETDDLRISNRKELIPAGALIEELPVTESVSSTVFSARNTIHEILNGKDDRLLAVVGPCSIHDPKAALEYGHYLLGLKEKWNKDLFIVMRVYFEKPRTTVGWKGLINDPNLDGSFEINKGVHLARSLLLNLNEMGMPAGTEYLDLITPQYVADLISWGAIGARTTESQGHRELASGLSCPVGFKNGTGGSLQIAADAIVAARNPHHFLSVTKEGQSAIFSTTGNEDCHIILRGGKQPLYDAAAVDDAAKALEKSGAPARIMIDTNHANSRKVYKRQLDVGATIAHQVGRGEDRIFGVMIESNLKEGNQKIGTDTSLLEYGKSITDPCIGKEDTETLLCMLAEGVRKRRSLSLSGS